MILLTLSYDGTAYSGWQRQNNAITVSELLETALEGIYHEPITVKGASRTDAGVHAYDQKASFSISANNGIKIPLAKLPEVLNAKLPSDIVIISAQEVPEGFNPRFSAISKTYEYNILNAPLNDPFLKRLAWHIPQTLDIDAMNKACELFIGTHDFAAFCASGGSQLTTERTINSAFLKQTPFRTQNLLTFTVNGNAFLYNMVRIMTGTLVYVGLGKLLPDDVTRALETGNRRLAGKTAPPQGLALVSVNLRGINYV